MNHNVDAPAQPGDDGDERAPQRIARMLLAAGLVLLGLWI